MTETPEVKQYDLEDRSGVFAVAVRSFVKRLPQTVANREDARQFVRSSGAIGANYIEANECLGKRDCVMRMRIARKEAKETRHWLRLVDCGDEQSLADEREKLRQEALELAKILGSMIKKLT